MFDDHVHSKLVEDSAVVSFDSIARLGVCPDPSKVKALKVSDHISTKAQIYMPTSPVIELRAVLA